MHDLKQTAKSAGQKEKAVSKFYQSNSDLLHFGKIVFGACKLTRRSFYKDVLAQHNATPGHKPMGDIGAR